MSGLDPYAQCPCGSGKKLKWCSPKVIEEVQYCFEQVENDQFARAVGNIERLLATHPEPRCLQMYLKQVHNLLQLQASVDSADGNPLETMTALAEEYPEFGFPVENIGTLFATAGLIEQAIVNYHHALEIYPAEASDARQRVYLSLARLYGMAQKPLAAWAHLRLALKGDPTNPQIQELLDDQMRENQILLPATFRGGGTLKSPDELAVFNDQRRVKWDAALASFADWNLKDLIATFDYLASDDTYDLAAWYNLGLAHAWLGNHDKAVEAFDHYVQHETNVDAAAEVWDLCEAMRLTAEMVEQSDYTTRYSQYEVTDPERFKQRLQECRHIMALRVGEEADETIILWLEREATTPEAGVVDLRGLNRVMARIEFRDNMFRVGSNIAEYQKAARERIEEFFGGSIRLIDSFEVPIPPMHLDLELAMGAVINRGDDEKKLMAQLFETYYEQEWIQTPLRSLGGMTPRDGAHGNTLRKKLEGVLRFRERINRALSRPYDFDRLRNKLGMASDAKPAAKADGGRDLSACSAAELAQLKPAELSDDELLTAYRAAIALDVPHTTANFARALIQRPAQAAAIDMIGVAGRVVSAEIDRQRWSEAQSAIDAAEQLDREHYGNEKKGKIAELRVRVWLAKGETEPALAAIGELLTQDAEAVGLAANLMERLFSSGLYAQAAELADQGYARAVSLRERDLQEQFRDYAKVARGRS